YTDDKTPLHSIWIANQDGSLPRFISYCSLAMGALEPGVPVQLSPDGKKVVFTGLLGSTAKKLGIEEEGIWLYDLEQNKKERIMPLILGNILWSSNSQYIYYEKGKDGVFQFDTSTGKTTKIVETGQVERIKDSTGKEFMVEIGLSLKDISPRNEILFTRNCYDFFSEVQEEKTGKQTIKTLKALPRKHIWVMDENGNTMREITVGEEPQWVDGGKKILFERKEEFDGNQINVLWLISLDGTGEMKIGHGKYPTVSPHGKQIAFVKTGENQKPWAWFDVCIFDIETHSLKVITPEDNWQDFFESYISSFKKKFRGYFVTTPNIVWISENKLLYHTDYGVFLADREKHISKPIFFWVRVSPFEGISYVKDDNTIVGTFAMDLSTARRKNHPMRKNTEWEEYDLGEVSLDKKQKTIFLENGFLPMRIMSK
ncbi:MAG: TolB family protein, partial [Brevinematales bacterium]